MQDKQKATIAVGNFKKTIDESQALTTAALGYHQEHGVSQGSDSDSSGEIKIREQIFFDAGRVAAAHTSAIKKVNRLLKNHYSDEEVKQILENINNKGILNPVKAWHAINTKLGQFFSKAETTPSVHDTNEEIIKAAKCFLPSDQRESDILTLETSDYAQLQSADVSRTYSLDSDETSDQKPSKIGKL